MNTDIAGMSNIAGINVGMNAGSAVMIECYVHKIGFAPEGRFRNETDLVMQTACRFSKKHTHCDW